LGEVFRVRAKNLEGQAFQIKFESISELRPAYQIRQ
jgi:hypothetical protein